MAIKPARWIWVVMQPHHLPREKHIDMADTQYTDATEVSAAMDVFSVTFFDLSGVVYALPGIHAACTLAESRELTAEERRILNKRPVRSEPLPAACDLHQTAIALVAEGTGQLVAISPASSRYGIILEVSQKDGLCIGYTLIIH